MIRNNSAASKSRDLWHYFWRLSSEERKSVTPVHPSLPVETKEHGPSVPTLFLHAPSWLNLSATHFESKGWQTAKICRMHRKKWRKSCKGIREKPRVVLGSGMCLGLRPGKTIKDQAKCGLSLRKKKSLVQNRWRAKSGIDRMTALLQYCQSYFTQTHLDLTDECFLRCFQPKIPLAWAEVSFVPVSQWGQGWQRSRSGAGGSSSCGGWTRLPAPGVAPW